MLVPCNGTLNMVPVLCKLSLQTSFGLERLLLQRGTCSQWLCMGDQGMERLLGQVNMMAVGSEVTSGLQSGIP